MLDTACILNPAANGLRTQKRRRSAENIILQNFGIPQEELKYQHPSEIDLTPYRNILLWSGDGGIIELLQASLEDRLVGIVPGGRGNEITKALNLPDSQTSIACAREAFNGDERFIRETHMGKITMYNRENFKELFFLGAVGMGIDSDAVAKISSRVKQIFGSMVYELATLWCLYKYEPSTYIVKINNDEPKDYTKVYSINASKVPTTGGHIVVCPTADFWGNYFDMCIIHGISKPKGIGILKKADKGKHVGMNGVDYFEGGISRVEICLPEGNEFGLHITGEYRTADRVVIEISPKKVRLVYNPNAA